MFRGCKLRQKEIIDVRTAEKLGLVSDVEINEATGNIDAVIAAKRGCFIGRLFGRGEIIIPWSAVEAVGDEVVLVRLFEPEKLGKSDTAR